MSTSWTTELDRLTTAFQNTFGHLSGTQLNWKPDAATWSIAQNIDHLIVINQTYYPVIKSVREGTYKVPFIGKFNFMTNFMGRTILNAVQPDRRKKMKTFPLWEPSTSEIPADILARFEKHQEELKILINSSDELIKKEIVISSPANKNIVYKLATAFDILVAHEQRHLEQAKEVLQLLNRKEN